MKIRSDEFKGSGVVSCQKVGMILVVVENCSYWTSEVNIDFGKCFFIAKDDVPEDMDLKVITMIEGNVKFLLSQSVLTSEIASLFQMKALD